MIPSSLELNSDDFPFFGDLKRTSRSREKLEKSSFENRDNHHRPRMQKVKCCCSASQVFGGRSLSLEKIDISASGGPF